MSAAASITLVVAFMLIVLLGVMWALADRDYRVFQQRADALEGVARLRFRALDLCCHMAIEVVRDHDEQRADALFDRRVRINMPGVRIDPVTLMPEPPEVTRVDRS